MTRTFDNHDAERQDDGERADAIWGGPDMAAMGEIVCLDLFKVMRYRWKGIRNYIRVETYEMCMTLQLI